MAIKKSDITLESEGLKLKGGLYVPPVKDPQASTPLPTLCLCHGIPSGSPTGPSDGGYPALAEKFAQAGFITLIFNFRGTGESEGNFDIAGWARDLEAALDYLYNVAEEETKANIDKDRIALMGFSAGAAVAVYVASRDHRVSALVSCACPTHFRLAANRESAEDAIAQFRATGIIRDEYSPRSLEEWMDGFSRVKPVDHIERISPRPLLLIQGDRDDVVERMSAWALYEQAGDPKEFTIIPGAGHRLRLSEDAMDNALNWLKKQLKQD